MRKRRNKKGRGIKQEKRIRQARERGWTGKRGTEDKEKKVGV